MSSSSSSIRSREKRGQPSSTTVDSPSIPEYNEVAASPIHDPTHHSSEAVQILDLHTSNPLISYQGRLYSSEWSTTLGTDILLTSSQSSESPVLAATRIKLSGRPVRMIRHHGASKPSQQPPNEAVETQRTTVEPIPPPINGPNHFSDKNPTVPRPVLEIPLDRHASVARQNQAHFLERLSAIKAARGEQDEVTVYAKKRYTGTGWRSRQRIQKDLDADDEGEDEDTMAIGEGDDDEDQDGDREGGDQIGDAATEFRSIRATAPPSRAGRQKISRSRGRARREIAGLFRDYRPNVENARGGSLRKQGTGEGNPAPAEPDSSSAISVPTPQTWDELVAQRRKGTGDFAAVADADGTIGPSSAAIEKNVNNQNETRDVLMEDV